MNTSLPTSKSTIGDFFSLAGDFYAQHWKNLLSIMTVIVLPLTLIESVFFLQSLQIAQQPDIVALSKSLMESKKFNPDQALTLLNHFMVPGISIIVLSFIGLFLSLWITIALITYIKKSFEQESLTWQDAYRQSASLWPKSIGLSIVMNIFLFLLFCLLIIPGIIFSIYWMFALTALVWSGKGILESLSYSKRLVSGNWWRMIGYALAIGITTGLINELLGSLVSFIATMTQLPLLDFIAKTLVSEFVGAFMLIFLCYVYVHLQLRLEESSPSLETL